jgi:predicted nucleic acid-binding protein
LSGFLLDTNIISELVARRPEPRVSDWIEATDEMLLHLSVLTLGEIRKGIVSLRDSSRRAALGAWLDSELMVRFANRILAVDEAIADRWGRLTAQREAANSRLPVIDGLLAATALQYNLTLVTRNVKDVAATGVPLFNPWSA